MENKLLTKESLDLIISEIKELIRTSSIDNLNSVQWQLNQRYLFGNEDERPIIEAGKLYDKNGPVLKGTIWTSLDTGRLYMNSGTGWKHIGGLGALTQRDIINIFNPRKDYTKEEPVSVENTVGNVYIPYKFKKYEKYAVEKTAGSITCRLVRSRDYTDMSQDISKNFSSVAGTYYFTCMNDESAYLFYTSGTATIEHLTISDVGSSLEPLELHNKTGLGYFNFQIEKGKTYYYTKTAASIYFAYGTGANERNFEGIQVHIPGDSGDGTFHFKAERDAETVCLLVESGKTLDTFILQGEDLPEYKLTYPYVVASADEELPSNPRIGDMVYNPYVDGGTPLWWNGSVWKGTSGGGEGGDDYASKTITITGTGVIGGGGTLEQNRTITHNNSGVTAGTYKSVTVNATGHVTAGSNPTTLAGYGITDAKIENGVITLGSNTITPITEIGDVVHKTGAETITGNKTFSDAAGIILQGANGAAGNKLVLQNYDTNSRIQHRATDDGQFSAIDFPKDSPDINFYTYGNKQGTIKASPAVNNTSVDILRGKELYNTLEQGGIVQRVGTGTNFTGDNKYWKKIFTLSNPNSKTWTDIDVEFEILGTYGTHMQYQNGLFKAYYSINGETTSTAIKLNRLSGNFDCNNVVYYKNASNQMEVWINTVARYDTVLVKYLTVWHRDLNNKLACTIEPETSTNGYTTSTALPSGTVAATDNGGFVHTSGDESISGVKTFTEKITLKKGELVHNVSINNSSANTWIRFATIKCIGSYASQNITMDIVGRSGVGRLRFYLTGTNATNGAFTGVVGKWLDYGDGGNRPIWYTFDTSKSEVYLWYKAPSTYEYFSIYNLGWGEYLRDKFEITWERTGTTTTQPTGATQVSIDKISTNIAGTADKATQDGDGNTISSTYLKLGGGTMTGDLIVNNSSMPLASGKVTGLAAGTSRIYKDGIAISNPTTQNDLGWIRVTGTGESDTVLEIATGDDAGTGETIAFRGYNTSNAIGYSVTVPKKSGTIALTSDLGSYLPLAGGTMNTGATITIPYSSGSRKVEINGYRYATYGTASGDWANHLCVLTNDGTSGQMEYGAFGTANTLKYGFIGTSYNSPTVKIIDGTGIGVSGSVRVGATKTDYAPMQGGCNMSYNTTTQCLEFVF